MSNDTGDSSSRLSDALNEIFSGGRSGDDESAAAPDPAYEPEPYELPDIVPATAEQVARETTEAPRLPNRAIVPEPAPTERPPTPAPDAAPTTARTAPATTPAPATPTTPAPAASTARPTAPATGWSDHMPAQTTPAAAGLRTPGRRPRVRRVTRVVRHVDPWSTFKIALLFNAVAYVVCLTSGVLLWRVADSTGTLDNVERWFTQFGWETFELDGGEVFSNAWVIGLFGVVAATGAAVLLVTLFNLVSDIVGGVRVTVLEEEVVERTISSTRRYVVRRPTDAGASGAAPDWSADDFDDDSSVDDAGETRPIDPTEPVDRVDEVGHDDRTGDRAATASSRSPSKTSGDAPSADWSVD